MSLKPPSTPLVSTTEEEAWLRTSLAASSPGDTRDLGGARITVASPVAVPAGVKVANFDIVASGYNALQLGAGAELHNGRTTRSSTGGTALTEQANILVTGNDVVIENVDTVGAMRANIHLSQGLSGVTIQGGTFLNTSRLQNACAVYAHGFGSPNERLTVEGIKLDSAWTAPDGLLLFHMSHARVLHNRIKGLRRLATLTMTGWVLQSGNVYRTTDRTDGSTRELKNNTVHVAENTATPTTPGSNEWGISGGFLYLNLGGTDPATRTITSDCVSGYAITLYATGVDVVLDQMNYNLVAHNEIADVDGFGIYWQMSAESHGNKSDHNTMENVCLTGLQVFSLPFAGEACSRGYDYELDGDQINGAGHHAFWYCNGAKGTAHGCTARDGSVSGHFIQTGDFTLEGCEGSQNDAYGFNMTTVGASHVWRNVELNGCKALNNASHGAAIDNTVGGGAVISGAINGGVYKDNGGRGIHLAATTDFFVGGGVQAHGNTTADISQGDAATARTVIDGFVIGNGSATGMTLAGGTDVRVGRGTNNATAKWTVPATGVKIDQMALSPDGPQTIATDAIFTLTPFLSPVETLHTGTLTANRAVTLSTTNAFQGCRFKITRTGAGAFSLTHAAKNIATGQWAEYVYTGAAWTLSSFGSL